MNVLIMGASARAAAYSAVRAGLRPIAIDLFADTDLAAIGDVRRIDPARYPAGLELDAALAPECPWIYTGGLENYPALVERIALVRPLWGNDGPVLRAVRDPFLLAQTFRDAGIPSPEVRATPVGLERDGRWMVKPRRSAGGRAVEVWNATARPRAEPDYYQQRIEGALISAVYVADGRESALLGVSRQLVGRPDSPFVYRGSVGPVTLSEAETARVRRIGEVVAARCALVGLFGVDFLMRDGVPWPLEVNPRYTASVEVLELATGVPFLGAHRDACTRQAVGVRDSPVHAARCVGKAMIFADRPTTIQLDPETLRPSADCWAVPRFGDIPAVGTSFRAGEPIMTVFAAAADPDACEAAVQRYADEVATQISSGAHRIP